MEHNAFSYPRERPICLGVSPLSYGGIKMKKCIPISICIALLLTALIYAYANKGVFHSEKTDALNNEIETVFSEAEWIRYENQEYGFYLYLPISWIGYSVIRGEWEGFSHNTSSGYAIVETGPQINVRHPLWSEENPRQDIPIMVFTLTQWDALLDEKFHIGAAPIGPKELGRNNKYVLALPARYNFAFLPGFEEVEEILENDAFKPIKN